MAIILNIETSSKYCSVAVSDDGKTIYELKDTVEMNHAVNIAPFVKQCLEEIKNIGRKLDALAVSIGPGSYTGLRIGLAFAKGLSFSLDIPLINIDTLELIATKGMFSDADWEGDEILIPMVDARRMEVYTTVLDSSLNHLIKDGALILDETSFSQYYDKRKILFLGDGAEKFKSIYGGANGVWPGIEMPSAADMSILSERAYLRKEYANIAYSVPNYLKEYQTTVSRSKII